MQHMSLTQINNYGEEPYRMKGVDILSASRYKSCLFTEPMQKNGCIYHKYANLSVIDVSVCIHNYRSSIIVIIGRIISESNSDAIICLHSNINKL